MRWLRTVMLTTAVMLFLSACEFSVYQLPLPGGPDAGDDPIEVTADFRDVLDLVPQSTVKVNDVSVGKVTKVELVGYTARVTLSIRNDIELPDNTRANIRQTSLLGEKFVSLDAPQNGGTGRLEDGDELSDVQRNGRNVEVEEVLSAMSLLLNGGGVAQLKTINQELNIAFEGRESSARSLLRQANRFVRVLDDNKVDIVAAMESLNRLAIEVNNQRSTIEEALDELPSAIESIASQRQDFVRMLQALNKLSNVGVRVIGASKESTIAAIEQLNPVLTQLANAGPAFIDALSTFYAFPFIDESVGLDPQIARSLPLGDYTNLSVKLNVDLFGELLPPLVCGEFFGDGDPEYDACREIFENLGTCLAGGSDITTCAGSLDTVLVGSVCTAAPQLPLCPPAADAPAVPPVLRQDGSSQAPPLNLDRGGALVDDLPQLGGNPAGGGGNDTPDTGGILGGLGLGRVAPSFFPGGQGPTMAQLADLYDADLVSIFVPGMVTQ